MKNKNITASLLVSVCFLAGCGKADNIPKKPVTPLPAAVEQEEDGLSASSLAKTPSTSLSPVIQTASIPKTANEAIENLNQAKPALVAAARELNNAAEAIEKSRKEKEDSTEITGTTSPIASAGRTPITSTSAANIASTKARLTAAIQERLTAIARLRSKLAAMKTVSEEYKSIIKGSLDNIENGLKEISAEAKSETDINALAELAATITDTYRVFDIEIPKDESLIAISGAQSIADEINASLIKLQETIIMAEQSGADVTEVKQEIKDLKAELAEVMDQLESATNEILSITPGQDPATSDARLASARTILEEARQDLLDIQEDLADATPELQDAIDDAEQLANDNPEEDPVITTPIEYTENPAGDIRRVQ